MPLRFSTGRAPRRDRDATESRVSLRTLMRKRNGNHPSTTYFSRYLERFGAPRVYFPWRRERTHRGEMILRDGTTMNQRRGRGRRSRISAWRRIRPEIQLLEERHLLATVNWISTQSGNWNVGSNWSTGQVPGTGDAVVIDVSGASPTVTINSGSQIGAQPAKQRPAFDYRRQPDSGDQLRDRRHAGRGSWHPLTSRPMPS